MPFTNDSISSQQNFYLHDSVENGGDSAIVVSGGEMFGAQSQIQNTEHLNDKTISNSNATSWMATGTLILYLLIIIAAKSSIAGIFSFLFFADKKEKHSKLPQNISQTANMFVNFSVFIFTAYAYLLLFKFAPEKDYNVSVPLQIIFIAAGLYAFFYFKKLIIATTGYITGNKQLKWQMNMLESSIFGSAGMAVVPFVVLAFLLAKSTTSIWMHLILIIIILFMTLKVFKIFQIFIREKISPFFLILYLCALEILPIWLIVDFFR